MRRRCGNVVVVLGIVSIVAQVIGMALPYWFSTEAPGAEEKITITVTRYGGLWQQCTRKEYSSSDGTACTGPDTDSVKAIIAMEVLGFGLMVVFLLFVIIKMCCFKDRETLAKIAGIIAIVGGVLILIGPIIFVTDVKGELKFNARDLHAGFGLCVAAAGLAILAGILTILFV